MAFQRIPGKFAISGMDLHHPPDALAADKCSLLLNLQPDTLTGALSLRPSPAALATTVSGVPIHSIVRLNDLVPEAAAPFARFVGSGTKLYSGAGGTLAQLDTGYSGNPLAFVPYNPSQSPESSLYTYDSLKQQAYKTDGTARNIGIASPVKEPTAVRIRPLYDIVEDGTDSGSWWSGGTSSGGSTSAASVVARVPSSTTATVVLYDTGTTGMACVLPSASDYAWMTGRSLVKIDSEEVVIEQAFQAVTATTVAAIAYDTGSTGLCTIVPTIPVPGVQRNMLLQLNSAIYVRVLSVTSGPDGSYSFRCSTGGTTISATQAITGVPSFRCWTTVNHTATAPLTGSSINFTFTPTVTGGAMQDIVATNNNSWPAQNLSTAGTRPIQNEDYMHLSLGFDSPQWVTEIHVLLDVDEAVNDFNHNYYYYVLRQGDFQLSQSGGVLTGSTTVQDQLTAISNSIASQLTSSESVDTGPPQPPYPLPEVLSGAPPAPGQLSTGSLGWLEAMFKINDLTRVGSDATRTLANVQKIGIYVFTSGGIVNMYFGGWWVGGGYGPDCNFNSYGNQGPALQWRYRYRNSLTGAHSTVSPETRNGEILRRQGINLTATASPDPQVDYVDWERRGGTNPDWHEIGSQPVSAGYTFLDNITEAAAQIGNPLEVTSYQPWPVTDIPHSGTATVKGTSVVWASGDQFNIQWLRGTEIILGGNTYALYAPPASATSLQLAQNVAPPSGVVAFSIPEATLESQPLYGAWLDEANNRVCAVGDPLNPGLMYFTNSDNPDGASDSGYLVVTSPSEPLLNGFYAEGSNYVFTNSSLYRVESTPGAVNPYVAYRLSGVEGMAGPWAFDAQRRLLFYWGPDGIYAYAFGPAADNLTAADLYPLFPHAGQQTGQPSIPGIPVSVAGVIVYPPNYAIAQFLRIAYAESFVYATYLNSNGTFETLVYSLAAKGWRKDTYNPTLSLFWLEKGIPNPALLCGGSDGNLYAISSTATVDPGGGVAWVVLPRVMDAGDSRAVKQWGDLMLDYSAAAAIGIEVLWDNLLVAGVTPGPPATGITTRTHSLIDLFSPPDTNDTPLIHYNFTALIAGVGPVFLYELQPSYLPLPEITSSRVTEWSGSAGLHNKFMQGLRLHFNTFGATKNLKVQYDGYQVGATLQVSADGEQTIPFSFPVPFKAHLVRLVPADDTPWEFWPDSEWIYQPEPEPANYWISQPTALGQAGYLHSRELWIAFNCSVAGAVISAIVDGTLTTIATLPATASPVKQYFPTPPLKGRYWQLTATGTGLQLYERDIEFLVKSWGSTGPYARVKPFGDTSGGGGASGALI